jgi:hypothetical protein
MNRAIIEPFKPNEVKEGLHEVSVAPRRPGGSVMARYVPPPAKTRIKAKRTVFLPICATRHRVLEAGAARVSPDTIAKILFNSAARLWRRASPQPR